MTLFYKYNDPISPFLQDFKEFEPKVHLRRLSDTDKEHCGCHSLWNVFVPLFSCIKDDDKKDLVLSWGGIGIINGKNKDDREHVFDYAWHLWVCDENTFDSVHSFTKELNEQSDQYLLLGKIAEFLVIDEKMKPEELPCLLVTKEKIENKDHLRSTGWDDEECKLINNLDPGLKLKWNNYLEVVSSAAASQNDSILFIPLPCYSSYNRDSVLAGGIIWCIKQGKVGEALKHLSEAQLFGRWVLSEILGRYPNLGLRAGNIERFLGLIDRSKNENWFATNGFPVVSHNPHYNDGEWNLLLSRFDLIDFSGIDDKGKISDGFKALILEDKPIPLLFLRAIMLSLLPNKLSWDNTDDLIPLSLPIDTLGENALKFIISLLSLCKAIFEVGADITVISRNEEGLNFLSFTAKKEGKCLAFYEIAQEDVGGDLTTNLKKLKDIVDIKIGLDIERLKERFSSSRNPIYLTITTNNNEPNRFNLVWQG